MFGVLFLILSEIFLLKKIEPFYSWFYCLAWWSYIFDSRWNHLWVERELPHRKPAERIPPDDSLVCFHLAHL